MIFGFEGMKYRDRISWGLVCERKEVQNEWADWRRRVVRVCMSRGMIEDLGRVGFGDVVLLNLGVFAN